MKQMHHLTAVEKHIACGEEQRLHLKLTWKTLYRSLEQQDVLRETPGAIIAVANKLNILKILSPNDRIAKFLSDSQSSMVQYPLHYAVNLCCCLHSVVTPMEERWEESIVRQQEI